MRLVIEADEVEQAVLEWIERQGYEIHKGSRIQVKYAGQYEDIEFDGFTVQLAPPED